MIQIVKTYILLAILMGTCLLNAQTLPTDSELESQLHRLETKLQSARHLAQILGNPDLFQFIKGEQS